MNIILINKKDKAYKFPVIWALRHIHILGHSWTSQWLFRSAIKIVIHKAANKNVTYNVHTVSTGRPEIMMLPDLFDPSFLLDHAGVEWLSAIYNLQPFYK
jgi:hypothetical protein